MRHPRCTSDSARNKRKKAPRFMRLKVSLVMVHPSHQFRHTKNIGKSGEMPRDMASDIDEKYYRPSDRKQWLFTGSRTSFWPGCGVSLGRVRWWRVVGTACTRLVIRRETKEKRRLASCDSKLLWSWYKQFVSFGTRINIDNSEKCRGKY